jgi:hypothetical protein
LMTVVAELSLKFLFVALYFSNHQFSGAHQM